jgi:hypothetical protein
LTRFSATPTDRLADRQQRTIKAKGHWRLRDGDALPPILNSGSAIMLLKISPHIADCLERAQRAHERAEKAADTVLQQDYLDIERTWLRLAESYRTAERLQAFIADCECRRSLKLADASDADVEHLAERMVGTTARQP